MIAVLLGGCTQSEEVEILIDKQVVWSSPLGSNRLSNETDLGISQYKHPAKTLTAHVDSPTARTELLFFAEDPQVSFTLFATSGKLSAGFLHSGGAATYPVGTALVALNGLKPQSIKALYQRRHGECELEVNWDTLFKKVVEQLDSGHGEEPGCEDWWCPDSTRIIEKRIASSYLRKKGVNGQGGFGLQFSGAVEFDSPILDNLSFSAEAGYDVSLSDGSREGSKPGLPEFTISSGECATAPFEANCDAPTDCDGAGVVLGLGNAARAEALDRGMSETRANDFRDEILKPQNWTCAPVTQTCADLVGVEPSADKVCQLKLRATDVVAMPNSFSLVWYPGDPGQNPLTAAQALYLGLTELGQADRLAQLCSPVSKTRARAFIRRVDDSDH